MSRAVTLAARVEQYLAERRRLGFDLRTMRYGLQSLVEHVRRTRHRGALTIEVMARWARQAKHGAGTNATWARKLRLLRPFTRWLQQFEPATEVPEESIFGPIPGRVAPHIYRDEELVALLQAAGRIGPPSSPRGTVMQTLFGLLACTGMRISEALALVDADVDLKFGVLTIWQSKFGKSRLVPLHPTTVTALGAYLRLRDRLHPHPSAPAIFISPAGTRLLYCNVHSAFQRLASQAGLRPRSASCRPRIHDLRHSFAVRSLLDAYAAGQDGQARLALLSTWLGHVDPGATYWYLSAAPELLALAGQRLDHHLRERP
jgi:integrase